MSVSLCPTPRFKAFYPGTGIPLAGGYLYTVLPGTAVVFGAPPTYPMATYTDSTGGTANTDPIVLDSNGEADVWLTGYTKLVLYDINGNLIWSKDNVSSMPNEVPSTLQFIVQSVAPLYVGPTQFSMVGNFLSIFSVGTVVQATVTSGYIYGYVSAVSMGGGVTTVTVNWISTTLDSSVSVVASGIIYPQGSGSAMPLYPTVPLSADTVFTYASLFQTYVVSSALALSITLTLPGASTVPPGSWLKIKNAYTGTTYTVTIIATVDGKVNPTLVPYDEITIFSDGTSWYGKILTLPQNLVPVRHTVLSGPITTGGLPNFLPATSGTLVIAAQNLSAAVPLVVTGTKWTAGGLPYGVFGTTDLVGSFTAASWTLLTASGLNYLWIDPFDGTCGSTVLAPVYQWYGTPSVTSNQYTFNISEMKMYVGNGSAAVPTTKVFVGEATAGASAITGIIPYAYQGMYDSGDIAVSTISASQVITFTHNIGVMPLFSTLDFVNVTGELGYTTGMRTQWIRDVNNAYGVNVPITLDHLNRNSIKYQTGGGALGALSYSTWQYGAVTAAHWLQRVVARRGW